MGVTVTDVDICDVMSVLCTHAPVFPLGQLQKSDLGCHVAVFWFHMSSETMVPAVTFLSRHPNLTSPSAPSSL